MVFKMSHLITFSESLSNVFDIVGPTDIGVPNAVKTTARTL